VLLEFWDELKLHYIKRDDEFGLYDGLKFNETRLWDLVDARGWDWPRTPTGRLKIDNKTLRRQAQHYPVLRKFMLLREQIAELRLNSLANTVGPNSFSRCPLLPFWTKTGRNQPSAKDKMVPARVAGVATWSDQAAARIRHLRNRLGRAGDRHHGRLNRRREDDRGFPQR
jgi:hypothetical protein